MDSRPSPPLDLANMYYAGLHWIKRYHSPEMRVLIVTQYFWPENFRINDLAMALRERGHEVTVFTGKPNYPEGQFFPGYGFFGRAEEDYGGVRVIRVPLVPRGGIGFYQRKPQVSCGNAGQVKAAAPSGVRIRWAAPTLRRWIPHGVRHWAGI